MKKTEIVFDFFEVMPLVVEILDTISHIKAKTIQLGENYWVDIQGIR